MTIQWRLSLAAGILGTILAGCSPAPVQQQQHGGTQGYGTVDRTRLAVESLLKQAETAPAIKAARLKVQAANLLLHNGQKQAAHSILEDVDLAFLPPALRYEIAQSRARAALDANQPQQALEYLSIPADPSLKPTDAQLSQLNTLRAEAYQQQSDPINEALTLIPVSVYEQNPETRQQFHNRIWQALLTLPGTQLRTLTLQTGNSYYEQGWFELALLHKQHPRLDQRTQAITEWNTIWDSHPARTLPPQTFASTSGEIINASRVAVLLPMQGKLAKASAAIREGLMAAYFTDQLNGRPVPELQFIDSSLVSTPEQLNAVIQERAIDLVIGPLDKRFVNALNNTYPMPAPVLALNYDNQTTSSQVYQFGLRPEDEARQAARKAWQDGHKVMLALVPETGWGRRIQAAFEDEFRLLGGQIADSSTFNQQSAFSSDVSRLLATDLSKARSKQIARMSTRKVHTQERRRKDADAIFLSALPNDARQLKPILAFHYAGNLPVYATSHIYSGIQNSNLDQDLNGIQFVETPWSLLPASETKRMLSQQRTDINTSFGRLYALGIDAYRLYPYLNQLTATEGASIQGETGALSIAPDKRVIRNLQWASFRNGLPEVQQPSLTSEQ